MKTYTSRIVTSRRQALLAALQALVLSLVSWVRPARAAVPADASTGTRCKLAFTGGDEAALLDAWLNVAEGTHIGRDMAKLLGRQYGTRELSGGPDERAWRELLTDWPYEELRLVRRMMIWSQRGMARPALTIQAALPGEAPSLQVQLARARTDDAGPSAGEITFVAQWD